MIGLVLGLLPFIVGMFVARMLDRHGLIGFSRPTLLDKTPGLQAGTEPSRRPPTVTSTPTVIDDAAVTEPTTSPWTTLDDLQLDRLLRESS